MNYKNIKIENRENYAIIEIANSKNNSLDQETLKEISIASKSINKMKKIKCIGLIGNSKFFSPGADIKELNELNSKKAKKNKLFSFVDQLEKIDIPIISFVEGYALGGGFELALSTDIVVASTDAKFGLPEINLGLIPGIGGTQKTKKFTSNQNIKYLSMTGEIINSETAMKFGIVSLIIKKEDFKTFTYKFLEKIASKPKRSLQIIKKLINSETSLKNGIKKERNEFFNLLDGENKKIGIRSFLNKTKPNWK
tara:strand:+ start:67 stop:825 length:759 start_codon:yes stop_codon:yes gene_type:complete